MSGSLDENNTTVDSDPDLQVRKLQELVKKLELQNQLLRNKQNDTLSLTALTQSLTPNKNEYGREKEYQSWNDVPSLSIVGSTADTIPECLPSASGHVETQQSFDDVALLDVHPTESLEDEETWLFCSPQKSVSPVKDVSSYKWVRQEFEQPSPEISSAKKALLHKLDEVNKVTRSLSAGSLANLMSDVGLSTPASDSSATKPVVTSKPPIRQPLLNTSGSGINTGTFTRPKKKELRAKNTYGTNQADAASTNSALPGTYSNLKENGDLTMNGTNANSVSASGESLDSERVGGGDGLVETRDRTNSIDTLSDDEAGVHRLTDVGAVQILAKMQEESLRQSFTTPKNPSKKGELSSAGRQSSSSLSSTSTASSPPDSPYASQYLNTRTTVHEPHRRSMPNLNRGGALSTLTHNSSDSKLSARAASPSTPSRSALQPPSSSRTSRTPSTPASAGTPTSSRTMTHSPGRAPNAGASLSPATSGIRSPLARSPVRRSLAYESPGARQASPNRSLDAATTHHTSATRSVPKPAAAPGSGIPRPGSASKLPSPRKSSIPGLRKPKSYQQMASPADDSWKDGCF